MSLFFFAGAVGPQSITIGPVQTQESFPALAVFAPHVIGPVATADSFPAMTVTGFGTPIGPVATADMVNSHDPSRDLAIGPVATEESLPGLMRVAERVIIGPVATEETLPALTVDLLWNLTLGPVVTHETIPGVVGDYPILLTIGPIATQDVVNAMNRRMAPSPVTVTPLYPLVFVHNPQWPRQQLAALATVHGLDYVMHAMAAGQDGRQPGQASFSIASNDSALDPDVLRPGALLAIEAPGLETWAGPLLSITETTSSGSIDLTALSIDSLLDARVARQPEEFVNSIGELAVLRTLLAQANARNPTGIIGAVQLPTGSPVKQLQTGGQSIMQALNEMTTRHESEWWVKVFRSPSTIRATLYIGEHQGEDLSRSVHLYSGVHFSGVYKADLSQQKISVTSVGDFGQSLPDRASVTHYLGGAPGIAFGSAASYPGTVRASRKLGALAPGARNEALIFEVMASNIRELAGVAARATELPLGSAEMFQDVFYANVDPSVIRPGNYWTRHGVYMGDWQVRVARMLAVQPDPASGVVHVVSSVKV